jgi:hypothetical protein
MNPSVIAEHRAQARIPQRQLPVSGRSGVEKPGRRPVYLRTRGKTRVDVDGAAFRVRAVGCAEVRYPLYRVSRVIANPNVEWSADALRACMEAGIPVVFVSEDGSPLGSVFPVYPRVSPLTEDIDELLDRPDWREIYAIWLRAARMRILRDWRSSRDAAGNPIALEEFKELVRKYVYVAADAVHFEKTTGIWRGAICALAATALSRMGLQACYWGSGGTPLLLLHDLTGLLELNLRLEIDSRMGASLVGEMTALRVFHAISERLENQCCRILASLARRIRQVLAEWR